MSAPLDLDEMERVAREAAEQLPGEWRINTDEAAPSTVAFLDRYAGEERWVAFAHCSGGCLEWLAASDHIAIFDPPTILRLIAEHRAAQAEIARKDAALEGMLMEWDKLTRYGSPLALAANERVAAARAALQPKPRSA